jgi:teichuronic acid biosynthesis glycosyltransferase TuaH
VKEMPHLNFLFVGKVFDQQVLTCLVQYKNVTFLPAVASESIPALQSKIDVGIIPYVLNSLTKAIYPLKANEYLAMGLPVVMTPFASLGLADEVVYTATNSNDFKLCLNQAIQEKSEVLTNKRLELAKNADWHERSNQLLGYIIKHKKPSEL